MKAYLDIIQKVLDQWVIKKTRTWTDAFTTAGAMFEHDMQEGFPLVTTKKIPFRLIASELEFFIKGMTNKDWLRERKNHIRDERCSPDVIPYSHDPEIQKQMMEEAELGPIYGRQRRNFWAEYVAHDQEAIWTGVDQLKNVVNKLKENPDDRRMIVMAWNPTDLWRMALPPCHYGFQVTVVNGKLNLLWNQRSVDVALGLPFNIASYGLLLHLLAKEANLEEWKLVGFLADVHIYENHKEWVIEQLSRELRELPKLETQEFSSIFDRNYKNSKVINYDPHPRIKFAIAV